MSVAEATGCLFWHIVGIVPAAYGILNSINHADFRSYRSVHINLTDQSHINAYPKRTAVVQIEKYGQKPHYTETSRQITLKTLDSPS